MFYRVRWEMDFEAKSAKEAARQALRVHRDPESMATCFDVKKIDRENFGKLIKINKRWKNIDL